MGDVEVETGGRKLIFTMREAKDWVAAGFARWDGRNKLRLTARCDSRVLLHGISTVVGEYPAVLSNQPWAETFIRSQLLRREPHAAK
jgi:hypothetical protein